MSKSNKELQREITDILTAGVEGKIDPSVCMAKVARRTLEQDGCEELLLDTITILISHKALMPIGTVCHLLMLRILRLEDDVRGLRELIAKEQSRESQEYKENETYRGEGGEK